MKPLKAAGCVLVILLVCVSSCTRIGIRDRYANPTKRSSKKRELFNACVITGKIKAAPGWKKEICIVAFPRAADDKRLTRLDHVIVKRTREFMIYVPEGRYRLFAFSDNNRNRVFESGECVGNHEKEVVVKENEMSAGILLTVGGKNCPGPPGSISIPVTPDSGAYTVTNGMKKKIYDEVFCHDNADIGWWEPTTFMQSLGANIYLLETYDPTKTPVLFVHGARGSPRDWAYMIMRLDTARYQPMVYYYPSGLRLSMAARLLHNRLMDLQNKLGFTEIYITAHSMGGIVTRSLLTGYDLAPIRVTRYITLATPWSGYDSADLAVKNMSKTLPSWIDIASSSEFIERTLGTKLPPSIDYYLFYGKADSTSKGRALDERSLAGSRGAFGFDVDHIEILKSRAVFSKYREILE